MRNVRITSVNFHRGSNRNECLGQAKALIEKALPQKPDIVLLPECFANAIETPETVPGPITDEMAAIARANGCYVVAPLYQRDGDLLYNSSVLIDRQGRIAAVYHKTFPTDYEIKDGVTPGSSPRAIETDFGRIGLAICFDLNFREVVDGYASTGTELILFSSAYEGGRQLCQWALEHSVYMVSAHWGGIGYFVDKTGHVLEKSNSWCHPVMTRTLNLDRHIFHLDYNAHYLDAIREEYGPAIHIDADVPEGRCAIESLDESVDVLEIKRTYGLELLSEYMARSRSIRSQALTDRNGIGRYLRSDEPYSGA